MLCSDCNKNNAEIFINKIENGVSSMEGLCRECAQKRGIEIPNVPPVNNNQGDQKNSQSNNKNNKQNANKPNINIKSFLSVFIILPPIALIYNFIIFI